MQERQQDFRKFLLNLAAVIGLFFAVVLGINLLRDPWGFRGKSWAIDRERFYKSVRVMFLRPDCVALGSSRTHQGIPMEAQSWPADCAQRYNLGLGGGTLYEQMQFARLVSVFGLKHVVWELDYLFAINGEQLRNPQDSWIINLNFVSSFENLLKGIFSWESFSIKHRASAREIDADGTQKSLSPSGKNDPKQWKKWFEENALVGAMHLDYKKWLEESVGLACKNKIQAYFYIPPYHKEVMDEILKNPASKDQYLVWRRMVDEVVTVPKSCEPYVHFYGWEQWQDLVQNDAAYSDPAHFNFALGSELLKRIFNRN